jgi:hypothetical protein
MDTNPAEKPSSPPPVESVFVPSDEARERRSRRWWWIVLALLTIAAVGAVVVMVYWPRFKPGPPRGVDAVEKAAGAYLDALVRQDQEATGRLGTVEEPPAIASYRDAYHQKARDRIIKGSFAPLVGLHRRIEGEFTYDSAAGRFTPKNQLGIAGETLDVLHAAKEQAEKSDMYKKMQSGDPNDIFDAAEQLASVTKGLAKLSEGVLSPRRLLPTYKMLVESSKPPLSDDAKALALAVAEDPKQWDALLKRPFWTLKPDGPFVYEEAEVTATARDKLASLGDPPSRLRLKLVRFQLETIDTGWKVVSARRVQPGEDRPAQAPASPEPPARSYSTGAGPADPTRPQ